MSLVVFGSGPLADHLRTGVVVEEPSAIIVPAINADSSAIATHELDDAHIESLFEQPMRSVIQAFQEAFHSGSRRIVVIVPTTSMSGGACYAATAALAEASRVLVKSAARQWGQNQVSVNAVSVEPRWFGIDPMIAGPVSIAAPALLNATQRERFSEQVLLPRDLNEFEALDPVPLVTWLCSSAAGTTTGQTLVCDGGQWM